VVHTTTAVLFESTDAAAVLLDPANQDWLAVVKAVAGERFESLALRYFLALSHFRRAGSRPAIPGRTTVSAAGKEQAQQGMLELLVARKASHAGHKARDETGMFVDPHPLREEEALPQALRDFSQAPPSLRDQLSGPGRPPCDALCLIRAFLGAPVMGLTDAPSSVFSLLRSNPTFARACGFLGPGAVRQPGELVSRRLPSLAVCEEFSEVMTRYGLWHAARIDEVRCNLATGVVEVESTLAFDTTHMEANSHCANVVPPDAKIEEGKRPKHRKVPRMRKNCHCGKATWETCEHVWSPTDQGAAVVVKGPTRVYWAHKTSVVSFGDSEIPIDVRVLQYASEHDGKTLIPHLHVLQREMPEVIETLEHVLADDAYKENRAGVAEFGQQARLTVPVHPNNKSKATIAAEFAGIARFTPIGIPVCDAGHRFEMLGRDLQGQRFIWAAPSGACAGCPSAPGCLTNGKRRNIRLSRGDFPQIDWDNPQHLQRNKARYQRRTGVERAIKRLKVDLKAEELGHRDSLRVQAHIDRKLLTMHLLLRAAHSGQL